MSGNVIDLAARGAVLLVGSTAAREVQFRSIIRSVAELRAEPDPAAAVASAQRFGPQILVLDLATDPSGVLAAMEALKQRAPHLPLVALASRKDPELILKSMRAGAREFVVLEDGAELLTVLMELLSKSAKPERRGSIVTVFPSKGGIGATTLAVNLAGALLEDDKRVALVDLDLHLGDVLVTLDMSSQFSISALAENMKRLDRELLMSLMPRHGSGVYVLSQSEHLDEADRVAAPQLGQMLEFLSSHFDYVVCDGLRGFDETSMAALDASHRIFLTLAQNVPSIKNTQRCLEVFRRIGYPDDKVGLIVNRYGKGEAIDLQSIADNVGLGIGGAVQNDYPTVMGAINRGLLLRDAAPRARVTEDIQRLALTLSGSGRGQKKGGFFRGLFKKGEGDEPKRTTEAG